MSDCRSCGGVPDCAEDALMDYYSLQSDAYSQVAFACPPGADCSGKDSLTLTCCDGQVISVTYPADATDAQREALKNGLLAEYYRRAAFCDGVNGDDPITDLDQLYFNRAATCTSPCPGGYISWTSSVAEGLYAAPTQDQADSQAQVAACALAQSQRICFRIRPNFTGCRCVDVAFTAYIYADVVIHPYGQPVPAMNWTMTGVLPPGVTFTGGIRSDRKCKISGTPTAAGTYTFTVSAAIGANIATRTFTYCINEITADDIGLFDDELLDAVEGQAYTNGFNGTACALPATAWTITSGALPAGLTLNALTGDITGTPTETGDFTFTIQMTSNCV